MSNKRLSIIIAVVALLAVAAGVIRFSGVDLTDYFQRHPNAAIPVTGGVAMDYFQRHPEVIQSNASVGLLDYSHRHPATAIERYFPGKEKDDLVIADAIIVRRLPGKEKDDVVAAVSDASDWIGRHPEALSKAVNANEFARMTGTYLPGAQGLTSTHVGEVNDFARMTGTYLPGMQGLASTREGEATDYIERHPELLKSNRTMDLSDWFQRHPDPVSR